MLMASVVAYAWSPDTQSTIVSVVIGVLSASVTGAALTSIAGRRSSRRTAHHAAFIELRDAATEIRLAAKAWGEADEDARPQLDSALVVASARFEFARLAVPSWKVRYLAGAWRERMLRYYSGDEAITLADESASWRAFAVAWGNATQSTY
jgi:hypothetical protein